MRVRRGFNGLIVDEGRLSGLAFGDAAADVAALLASVSQKPQSQAYLPIYLRTPKPEDAPLSTLIPIVPTVTNTPPAVANNPPVLVYQSADQVQAALDAQISNLTDQEYCETVGDGADPAAYAHSDRCLNYFSRKSIFDQFSLDDADKSAARKKWMLWISVGLVGLGALSFFLKED